MCTVTIVPACHRSRGRPDFDASDEAGLLLRLACNRDEQRSRPPALPPVRRTIGDRTAVMPVDPESGGTWIAANDAGLVACLLNANPPDLAGPAARDQSPMPLRSRARIVPHLIASESVERTLTADAIDPRLYPPFSVLLADERETAVIVSDGRALRMTHRGPLSRPVMLTSSGLGDHLVEPPRRALFDSAFASSSDPLDIQQRFHSHAWPDRPHLSVLMSRPDARTVSRTVIDLRHDSILMNYMPLNDGPAPAAPPASIVLPLAPTRVAP